MQLNTLSIENGCHIIIIYSLRDGKSRDRIPMKEIFRNPPDRPWGPLCLLYNGYRVITWGKAVGAWR
jgi:hypothetical protein